MLRRLVFTSDDVADLIARVTLGIVIPPHGLQKLFGLFGGHGFSATISSFTCAGIVLSRRRRYARCFTWNGQRGLKKGVS